MLSILDRRLVVIYYHGSPPTVAELSIHATRSDGILRPRSPLASTEGCTRLKAPCTSNDESDNTLHPRHASYIFSTSRLRAFSADLFDRPRKWFSGTSVYVSAK